MERKTCTAVLCNDMFGQRTALAVALIKHSDHIRIRSKNEQKQLW